MAFHMFHEFFPELAITETRSITLVDTDYGLPAGEYAFFETYCSDELCDCRRVIFQVMKKGRNEPIATIAWGWEPKEFYGRRIGVYDSAELDEFKGPTLNPLSPQSELAQGALTLCREVLLLDADYVERIKEHYRMFKRRIDSGKRPRAPSFINLEAERKRRQKAKEKRKAQKLARRKNRR